MKQFGEGKRPFNFFLNPRLRAANRKKIRRNAKNARKRGAV